MKILAIEKEITGVTESDYLPFLEAEALKAWELQQSGLIREMYFTDESFAVIVLEADNKDHAREILEHLPLVRNKLIDFEIHALNSYPGFSRLFKHV